MTANTAPLRANLAFYDRYSAYICRSAGHSDSKKPFKGLSNHVNIGAFRVTRSTLPIISHMAGQVTLVFRECIPDNSYCSSYYKALNINSVSTEMLLLSKTCIFVVKK